MPNEIHNLAEAGDAAAVVDGGVDGADARGDHAVAVFESEGGALPAEAPAEEVQGLAAGEEAEVLTRVSGDVGQFEPVERLARRYRVQAYAILHRFEGRVLLTKWIGGKPCLRTVDVEREFDRQ